MKKELTCIECPRGCLLTCIISDSGDVQISGNSCPRGAVYGKNECTYPKRTVTTTMLTSDASLVSCKTKEPIPKEKIFNVMREINATVAKNDVKIGDVLIENVDKTGVCVVATSNHVPKPIN